MRRESCECYLAETQEEVGAIAEELRGFVVDVITQPLDAEPPVRGPVGQPLLH